MISHVEIVAIARRIVVIATVRYDMINRFKSVAIAQRVVVIATVRYDMINRVEVALDALKSTQSRDAL